MSARSRMTSRQSAQGLIPTSLLRGKWGILHAQKGATGTCSLWVQGLVPSMTDSTRLSTAAL